MTRIKRYGFAKGVDFDSCDVQAIMAEKQNGAYVRYEDLRGIFEAFEAMQGALSYIDKYGENQDCILQRRHQVKTALQLAKDMVG